MAVSGTGTKRSKECVEAKDFNYQTQIQIRVTMVEKKKQTEGTRHISTVGGSLGWISGLDEEITGLGCSGSPAPW